MRATKIRQDLLLRLQSSLLPGNKKAFKRLQARRPFTYFLTLTPAFINNFTNENIPTHWAFSGVDGKRSLQGFKLETILRLPSEIVTPGFCSFSPQASVLSYPRLSSVLYTSSNFRRSPPHDSRLRCHDSRPRCQASRAAILVFRIPHSACALVPPAQLRQSIYLWCICLVQISLIERAL